MNFYGSTRMQQMLTYLKNYLTERFNGKQDTLTFDEIPTENSRNPVRSGGIFNALATKIDGSNLATVATTGQYSDLNGKPTIDSALSGTSENAVQNKVVKTALDGKVNDNDSRLSDARTPLAHTHSKNDITGLPNMTWTRIATVTMRPHDSSYSYESGVPIDLFENLNLVGYEEIKIEFTFDDGGVWNYMNHIFRIEPLFAVEHHRRLQMGVITSYGDYYYPEFALNPYSVVSNTGLILVAFRKYGYNETTLVDKGPGTFNRYDMLSPQQSINSFTVTLFAR